MAHKIQVRDLADIRTHYDFILRSPAAAFLPAIREVGAHYDVRRLNDTKDTMLRYLLTEGRERLGVNVPTNVLAPCMTALRFEDSGRHMYYLPKELCRELPKTEGKLSIEDLHFPHQTFYVIFEESPFLMWDVSSVSPSGAGLKWRRVDGAYLETGLTVAGAANASVNNLDGSNRESLDAPIEMMSVLLWSRPPRDEKGREVLTDDMYFFRPFPVFRGEGGIEDSLMAIEQGYSLDNIFAEINMQRRLQGREPVRLRPHEHERYTGYLREAMLRTREVVSALFGTCVLLRQFETPVIHDGPALMEEALAKTSKKRSPHKRQKEIRRLERTLGELPLGCIRYVGGEAVEAIRQAKTEPDELSVADLVSDEQEGAESEHAVGPRHKLVRHWVRPHGRWVRTGPRKDENGEAIAPHRRPSRWVWVSGFWRGEKRPDAVSLTILGA